MEPLIWITLPIAAAALVLALIQWTHSPSSTRPLEALSRFFSWEAVRVGLFQEGVALLVLLLVCALGWFLCRIGLMDPLTPWAVLSGGVCTALAAGSAATLTSRSALGIAELAEKERKATAQSIHSAGIATGMGTQAMALLHTAGWYCVLRFVLKYEEQRITGLVMALGLGCALYALSSGLVGSLLAQGGTLAVPGLPADAPENPTALIHWAGKGASSLHSLAADSFSVWVCVFSSALTLGSWAFPERGMGEYAKALPLAVAALGAFGSLLGAMTLRDSGELTGPDSVSALLRRGRRVALGLTAVMALPVSYLFSGSWRCCCALLSGFAGVVLLRRLGQWFTAPDSLPVWKMIHDDRHDGAVLLLDGLAWSLGGVCLGLLVLILCLLGGYFSLGGLARPERGVYGAALAGVGLVSALGMELTAGTCGAVASSAMVASRLGDLTEGLSARLEGMAGAYRGVSLDFRNWLTGTALLSGVVVCLTAGLRSLVGAQLLTLIRVAAGFLLGLVLVVLFSLMILFAVRRTGQGLGVSASRRFQKDEMFFYRAYLGIGLGMVLWEVLLIFFALVAISLAGFLLGREAFWGLCLAVTGLAGVLSWCLTAAGLSWSSVLEALTAAGRVERDSDQFRDAQRADVLARPLEGALGAALTELILLSASVTLLVTSLS